MTRAFKARVLKAEFLFHFFFALVGSPDSLCRFPHLCHHQAGLAELCQIVADVAVGPASIVLVRVGGSLTGAGEGAAPQPRSAGAWRPCPSQQAALHLSCDPGVETRTGFFKGFKVQLAQDRFCLVLCCGRCLCLLSFQRPVVDIYCFSFSKQNFVSLQSRRH